MERLLVMGRALFETMHRVNNRENQICAARGKRLLFFRPRRVRSLLRHAGERARGGERLGKISQDVVDMLDVACSLRTPKVTLRNDSPRRRHKGAATAAEPDARLTQNSPVRSQSPHGLSAACRVESMTARGGNNA
jgi:hypothetical protein